MPDRNPEIKCGTCPYFTTHSDVLGGMPICIRYPKWERKDSGTTACGEHPDYLKKAADERRIREGQGVFPKLPEVTT